jgi:HD-like signal output (HDOD) protein
MHAVLPSAPTAASPEAGVRFFLADAASIPAMPEIGLQLVRWMGRDDISLQQVSDLVGRDQSLAAKVLRLASSARFGRRSDVLSLRDAAALIGQRGLRDLALSACFASSFPATPGFERERFWCRSLATAGHARVLAELCGQDGDLAYLAGMLLHIGQLLMLQVQPRSAVQCAAQVRRPDDLAALERLAVGCNHMQVSAGLARHWQFPPVFAGALEAAATEVADTGAPLLGHLLRLAAVLADAGDLALPEWPAMEEHQRERLACAMAAGLHPEAWAARAPSYQVLTLGAEQLLH